MTTWRTDLENMPRETTVLLARKEGIFWKPTHWAALVMPDGGEIEGEDED